jgi:CheY-like chemotaxis protein
VASDMSEDAAPKPAGQTPTVLNINDEDAIRYVLTRMLKSGGFTVTEAANGAEGIAMSRNLPDLILLDVQLPDMHGFQVCQIIKADPVTAHIPILMISATLVQTADKDGGLQSGAIGYLTHPIAPVDLIAAVNGAISPQS